MFHHPYSQGIQDWTSTAVPRLPGKSGLKRPQQMFLKDCGDLSTCGYFDILPLVQQLRYWLYRKTGLLHPGHLRPSLPVQACMWLWGTRERESPKSDSGTTLQPPSPFLVLSSELTMLVKYKQQRRRNGRLGTERRTVHSLSCLAAFLQQSRWLSGNDGVKK